MEYSPEYDEAMTQSDGRTLQSGQAMFQPYPGPSHAVPPHIPVYQVHPASNQSPSTASEHIAAGTVQHSSYGTQLPPEQAQHSTSDPSRVPQPSPTDLARYSHTHDSRFIAQTTTTPVDSPGPPPPKDRTAARDPRAPTVTPRSNVPTSASSPQNLPANSPQAVSVTSSRSIAYL